jgi:transcriptional regulator with XRE-family HTH domain
MLGEEWECNFVDRKYQASYFEQRFRNRIYEGVVHALENECKAKKWKRKDLAERTGRKESQISRWLSGPGNWTLDTVSDLLFAIDAELDFKVTGFKDKKKKNEYHPLNDAGPVIVPLKYSKPPAPPKPFELLNATSSTR